LGVSGVIRILSAVSNDLTERFSHWLSGTTVNNSRLLRAVCIQEDDPREQFSVAPSSKTPQIVYG